MGKRNKNRKDDTSSEKKDEVTVVTKTSEEITVNKVKGSKKKNKVNEDNKTGTAKRIKYNDAETPKKIKFGEDGNPEQISSNSSHKIENKDKSYLNVEEQQVNDDEIDQFCDEIDEQDNKQYENWILLLEEKLDNTGDRVKNKNKTKNKSIV
ncbi:unnamed protein product [Leptosia nina]|uniref:Uncharacterized protein n=1 Tax=Leptosia nina TaxID=320188 RepID=A0AAV1K3Z1_9NEOP